MKIDIWSDVVCPWCYIGKRRFEAALADFEHAGDVEVRWRSFELDPNAPDSREVTRSQAELLAEKMGRPLEQVRAMQAQVTSVAASVGLDYRLDQTRPGNSLDAHRLLHLALEHGLQDELKERFDAATFTEGLSVSDPDELSRLAVEVGLDEGRVRQVLDSDEFADAVRADESQARAYGISGVPFFVIDGRYGVSGAQESDAILGVLRQAWQERRPIQVVAGEGAPACDGDDCSI
jgi:predicted DsbA family dithiol-disulfide isomerase